MSAIYFKYHFVNPHQSLGLDLFFHALSPFSSPYQRFSLVGNAFSRLLVLLLPQCQRTWVVTSRV